jgi:hypothetical protein
MATMTPGTTPLQPGDHVFVTELVPANNSGAHGVAAAVLHDNTLTVEVAAEGLEPNQIHEMHIHGFPGGSPSAQLPTLAQDANHDGLIENTEAETVIGPVQLSLTKSGTITTIESGSDFPAAAANGTINFHQTYTFNSSDPSQANILNELQSLRHDAIEIHGETSSETASTSGMSGMAGTSGGMASPSGSFDPSLPVANGLLHEVTGTVLGTVVGNAVLGSDPTTLLDIDPVDAFALGHA